MLASPINVGEDKYFMGVVVRRSPDSQKFYTHELVLAKENGDFADQTRTDNGITSYPSDDYRHVKSILDEILSVNRRTE